MEMVEEDGDAVRVREDMHCRGRRGLALRARLLLMAWHFELAEEG